MDSKPSSVRIWWALIKALASIMPETLQEDYSWVYKGEYGSRFALFPALGSIKSTDLDESQEYPEQTAEFECTALFSHKFEIEGVGYLLFIDPFAKEVLYFKEIPKNEQFRPASSSNRSDSSLSTEPTVSILS